MTITRFCGLELVFLRLFAVNYVKHLVARTILVVENSLLVLYSEQQNSNNFPTLLLGLFSIRFYLEKLTECYREKNMLLTGLRKLTTQTTRDLCD